MDLSAHADDSFQGDAVKLGEFGQQIDGVEGRAQHRHGKGSHNQTDDGAVAALMGMVPDGSGENEAAAHHKIGKVADKGGGGALEKQLQQDFDALGGYCRAGSQIEAAEQNRQLGEVQLVKFRSHEKTDEGIPLCFPFKKVLFREDVLHFFHFL